MTSQLYEYRCDFCLYISSFQWSDKSKLDLLPHVHGESYFSTESEFNKTVLAVYSQLNDFWYNESGNTRERFFATGEVYRTRWGRLNINAASSGSWAIGTRAFR